MALGWSRRERLMYTARRFWLRIDPSISDDALENLINSQPATDEQREFIARILAPKGLTVPSRLTYGRAREAMKIAREENLNYFALEALSMNVQRLWQVGSEYYLIVAFYGEEHGYKILVERVVLTRDDNAPTAQLAPTGEQLVVDPVEMLECMAVNPAQWPHGYE